MAGTLSTRFPRPDRKALFLGLRPAQLALLVFMVLAVAVAALSQSGAAVRLSVFAAGLAAGVVAAVPMEGMPAYRWILLRGAHHLRRHRRQQSFRARPLAPRVRGSLHLPGQAGSLRVLDTKHSIAVIHDPHRRRITAIARIESPAHLLQNSDQQDRRVVEYGRMIASLCHGGRVARAQIIERTLPDSGDGLTTWANERNLDPTTPTGAVYAELLQRAAPASARHETLFGLSLSLDAISRDARRYGGGLAGAVAVLEAETRAFQFSFSAAGVGGVWLTAPQLATSLRLAFDPAAAKVVDRAYVELDLAAAGPLAIDADWDHLRTDSSFHRVYVIAEWPRVRATPSFLSPLLLKPGVRRTFSIVLQPVPIGRALRDARRDRVERLTDRATRARLGQLETEQDKQIEADVAQREADLAAGHGDVRWVGLLVVSADDLEALNDSCNELENAASQALLDMRKLVGQQAEAFLAASLPFGSGLE
ncbi:SCO6880 family protein [Kribbella deserti]|uniref:SCO6880 family protein n=1 Tax=Kribbella deserti TaxID=1926257 RepID=A0ABV6QS64_9ACTN